MALESILSDNAPAPIGPYSQAVSAGGFIFTAGQIGLDPAGAMVEGGVEEQARQALLNIDAILQAAGVGLRSVVKTTIFLKDFEDFGRVNGVYAEIFGDHAPARSTVEVARLPKDALVEIEAVAHAS